MNHSFITSNMKMNRHSDSDRKHPRKIMVEEPPHKKRQSSYTTKLTNSSRIPLDSTFVRTVSKEDSSYNTLGSRFEPPAKNHRESRDDTESSFATDQSKRGKHKGSYRNVTMKTFASVRSLVNGAFEGRHNLVSSSLSAFWTRAACLLEEENGNDTNLSQRTQDLHDKVCYFLRRTEDTIEDFGSNNMSQTLTAMGKIYKQGRKGSCYQVMFYDLIVDKGVTSKDSIFLKIANVAVHRLERYDSQALSTTAITFARIGVAPTLNDGSSLFDHIAFHAMRRMGSFNPQGLSTLVWAFVTVQVYHAALFKMVADAALGKLHLFNPQNLSNLVWSYAKVNQSSPRLFKRVAYESLKFISSPESCPQNISNTLWSFASAEIWNKDLFEASANRMMDDAADFNPQELANSASAFALFGNVDHALFKTIGDEATRKLTSFLPQNMSNLVHAFAVAGVSHPNLFDKVASEAMYRLQDFNSQELANLSWSFAKAKESNSKLFGKIAEEVLERLDEFREPQHLSNVIWSFATAKLPHIPLFAAVADVVIARKQDFSPQQTSNLIWSYSYVPVGPVNQLLCKSFEPVVYESINGCDSQFFANVAWAYAVADIDAPSLFGKHSPFIRAILSRQQEFNLEALCQLHQFILWRKELNAEMPFPSSFDEICYNAYIVRDPSPSAFQEYVMCELKAIGLEPQEEYLSSTGYSLDALVEVHGEYVGIEVDGPFHFAGKGQPLGKMTLKHRQVLNVAGISIVSIPYWEWEGCIDKQSYLRSKLDIVEDCNDDFKWIL